MVTREHAANSVPAVFKSDSQATSLIRARNAKGTIVHADEAASWANLHERFAIKRSDHPQAYSLDGACAHMAEEHVDIRRATIGIPHHITGTCLLRFAQGCARRDDNPHLSDGDQVNRLTARQRQGARSSRIRRPFQRWVKARYRGKLVEPIRN
jgi:hypothetical protein